MPDDHHGWFRCTHYSDHGSITEAWFQHPWTATTTAWVVAWPSDPRWDLTLMRQNP